jgi:osmotically inducible protein OsmC
MADSRAECTWEGNLANGNGVVSIESGTFGPLPVTWAGRTQRTAGKTSPEELIAGALASCWCMATSHGLTQNGTPPTRLHVAVQITFDAGKISPARVNISGKVPGVDQAKFAEIAKAGCPVSRALAGVEIVVDSATLEG